jgi:hypothetical protein
MNFPHLSAIGAALLSILSFGAMPLPAQQPARPESARQESASPESASPESAHIDVEFHNPNLSPQHWKLTFDDQGRGQFDAEAGPAALQPKDEIALGEIHRTVQLSPEFTAHVFTVARERKLFAFPCESHLKVAFQGAKRLTYTGPEGSGSCEFNYSKDKTVQQLGEELMAVENTILSGERLEKYLQHDRLGLDKQMEDLYASAQSHSAIEMCAIRDTLDKIASSDQVLERARRRARLLLAQSPGAVAAP